MLLIWHDVVEEDTTYASGFTAMRQVEVAVAPCLEARIEGWVIGVTDLSPGIVEMTRILVVEDVWRQIATATKPARLPSLDVAKVSVNGRDMGIAGVNDKRNARREEDISIARHHLA